MLLSTRAGRTDKPANHLHHFSNNQVVVLNMHFFKAKKNNKLFSLFCQQIIRLFLYCWGFWSPKSCWFCQKLSLRQLVMFEAEIWHVQKPLNEGICCFVVQKCSSKSLAQYLGTGVSVCLSSKPWSCFLLWYLMESSLAETVRAASCFTCALVFCVFCLP